METEQATAKTFDPNCDPAKLARIGAHVRNKLNANKHVLQVDVADLELYVYREFLNHADCATMIRKIDAQAVPSTLYKGTEQPGFRTSFSCHMNRWDADVARIETRISDVIGIHNDYAETMQGQRYAVGQEFKAHHDFFHTSEHYWQQEANAGGQRSWTAMIFLNIPDEGGETEFHRVGIGIRPEVGTLLMWNNAKPDGSLNYKSLHAGTPVKAGMKHIITKWFRQNNWTELTRGK